MRQIAELNDFAIGNSDDVTALLARQSPAAPEAGFQDQISRVAGSPLFVVSGCGTETPPPITGTNGFTFGSLSKCNADTKSLLEGTIGFWIKAHSGPHGRLQFGPQYSYVARYAWTGTNGATTWAPHGIDNMFFTSFRYYLP